MVALSSVYLELERTREEIPVPTPAAPRPHRTEVVMTEIGSQREQLKEVEPSVDVDQSHKWKKSSKW